MKTQPNTRETIATLETPPGRGPVRRSRTTWLKHNPEEILAFIIRYKREHDGNSPSMREIMRNCNISSNAVAFNVLRRLEREGRIRLEHRCGVARSIAIPGGRWTLDEGAV